MKKRAIVPAVGFTLCLLTQQVFPQQDSLQNETRESSKSSFTERSLSGLRVGFTVFDPHSAIAQRLERAGISRVLSQVGWDAEIRLYTIEDGPAFLVQIIPLVWGLEYGQPLATFSFMMTARTRSGWDLGVGRNAIVGWNTVWGHVLALGKAFDINGASISLNVAYASNRLGSRVSFIVGYAP